MKNVIIVFLTTFLCSLNALCQVESIVSVGTESLGINNFLKVKKLFDNEGFKIDKNAPSNSETYAVGMDGKGDFALMWSIEANNNQTIKEISFICGAMHWYGIDDVLINSGYTLKSKEKVKLINGAIVPQKTYSKGNIHCMIRRLDNAMAHVIFKRK